MIPSERKLAHLVAKIALHIHHNEGRIEHHNRILKKTEAQMKQAEQLIIHYKKLAANAEQRAKELEKKGRKSDHEKRTITNYWGMQRRYDARLNALRAMFQKHLMHKVGLERHELIYLWKAKDYLTIIQRKKVMSSRMDRDFVGRAVQQHELTKSQADHLRSTLSTIPNQLYHLGVMERKRGWFLKAHLR